MRCVLVWLAVMATTFHTSQAMCRDGSRNYQRGTIIVRGFITTNRIFSGWIQICDTMNRWRAVCDNGWGNSDAMVACGQLGYSGARHCRNSCNGNGDLEIGIRDFACRGTETQLLSCTTSPSDNKCSQYAGIICWNLTPTPPPTTSPKATTCAPTTSEPTMGHNCTCPPAEDTVTTSRPQSSTLWEEPTGTEAVPTDTETTEKTGTTTSVEGGVRANPMMESCPSLTALGGGLGGLSAILAILLVGVVMGWVWSCNKKIGKSGLQERAHPHTYQNHSYSLPNTSPSVQYSSLGPRGTPHTHSPSAAPSPADVINERVVVKASTQPQGSGEGIYHVLEGPQEGGQLEEGRRGGGELEEGEYYLVGEVGGETYEVPISTTPAQPATQQVAEPMDKEYSTLQHQ